MVAGLVGILPLLLFPKATKKASKDIFLITV